MVAEKHGRPPESSSLWEFSSPLPLWEFSLLLIVRSLLSFWNLAPKAIFFFQQKVSPSHWTMFFFKIIQHCETWNVIGLFPLYKLEEIELILFFKSCIIQIFCTSNLCEFAILHSQTSWIIQVVSYKSFNVRRA